MIDIKKLKKGDSVYFCTASFNIYEYVYDSEEFFLSPSNIKKDFKKDFLINLFYTKEEAIAEEFKSSLNEIQKKINSKYNNIKNLEKEKNQILNSPNYLELKNKYPELFI
jgi:hypothetical protein